MKSFPILTTALITLLFIASCKNSGKSDLPIPKDAVMVLHINTSALTSKLNWKEIKDANWFQDMAKDQKDSVTRKIMENPESSGVDIKSDFAYFIKKQGKGGYMVFEGKLRDAAAFEKMVTTMKENTPVQKDGDLKYILLDKSAVVTWSDSRFFVVNDAPFFEMGSPFGRSNTYDNPKKGHSADSLRFFTKGLLSLSSDNSIEKDDRFSSLMKESGDVHLYFNTDQYYSSMAGGMLSMLKMNSLFKDNASTMTLNFDDGKIVLKSKTYFGEEMKKVIDKFKTKKIDEAIINRISSKDVVGVLAVNVDPAGLREMLKATGFDGMVNGFLGELDYSLDELLQATDGEFIVAVTDLQMKNEQVTIPAYAPGDKPYSYSKSTPDMKVLFASSVNNKQSFDKLLGIAKERMGESMMQKINFKVSNDWFVAGSHAETVDAFMAGGNNKHPFANKISGHSMGMYVDLQKVFRLGQGDKKNESDSTTYVASMNMWQDMVATMGEYKNGTMTSECVVNLVDKSTNSLKQLNLYAQKMFAANKMKREKYEDQTVDNMGDTTTVEFTPPVIVAPKLNQ